MFGRSKKERGITAARQHRLPGGSMPHLKAGLLLSDAATGSAFPALLCDPEGPDTS